MDGEMVDQEKPNSGDHLLVRLLDLPPCAADAFAEQRRFRRGTLRQRVGPAGWIGALVLLAGVGVATAQQQGLLSSSVGWRVFAGGMYLAGILTIGFSAAVSYYRRRVSAAEPSAEKSNLNPPTAGI